MGLLLVSASILLPQSFQEESHTVAESLHVNSVACFGLLFNFYNECLECCCARIKDKYWG